MLKSTIYGFLTFILLLVYCCLWIWQGLDFTDEGYQLTSQWLKISGHQMYYGNELVRWFSPTVGGAWLVLTESLGLLGARLGWALVVSLTGFIAFHILKKITDSRTAFLYVILTAFILTYHCILIINYNVFPALLLILAIWALLNAQIHVWNNTRQSVWAIICGIFLGLSSMARFPLIISVLMPCVPSVIHFSMEKRINARLLKLACLSIFSAFITICCAMICLYNIGILDRYATYLYNMIFSTSNDSEYSSNSLLAVILKSSLQCYVVGIVFSIWALFSAFEANNLFLRKNTATLFFSLCLFIPLLFISYYYSVTFPDFNVLFHYYNKLLPGLLIVFVLLFLIIYGNTCRDSIIDKKQLIVTILGFIYAFSMALGSGNGISNVKHGMWLAIPLAVSICPDIIAATGNRVLKVRIHAVTLKRFFTAALCILAITGLTIRLVNPYRDSRSRINLRATIPHKRLVGIHTSPGRSKSVKDLLSKLDPFIKKGDIILAYNSIPMLHYLTQTIPALKHPWPSIMQYKDLDEQIKKLEEQGSPPSIVVRSMTNTRFSEWGNPDIKIPPPAYTKRLKRIDNYVLDQGYLKLKGNRDFQILILPEVFNTISDN